MQDTQKPGWVNVASRFAYPQIQDGTVGTLLGNQPTLELLAQHTEEAGGQVLVNTECTALVVEDGRAVGIKVTTPEKEDAFYKVNNGVILTAGCFGMNLDLLEQYCPTAYMEATQGGPMPWATGECFRMGLGVDVSGFNSWDCWDGAAAEFWVRATATTGTTSGAASARWPRTRGCCSTRPASACPTTAAAA